MPETETHNPVPSEALAEAEELYARLWYAERDGKLAIGIDLRAYNKPGSPTFSRADNALPLVATLCCTASAGMLGGWIWALGVLGSGIIFSLTTLNVWIMHRLRQRTMALALGGRAGWQMLWDFGGVSVRPLDAPQNEIGSEDSDWQAFARRLPPAHTYEG